MLGIRRFGTTQIDLWQGDPSKFSVDLSWPSLMGLGQDFSCLQTLQEASKKERRHVSLLCQEESKVEEMLETVSSFLTAKPSTQKFPGRITIITPSSSIYDALQTKLFSTFKDI